MCKIDKIRLFNSLQSIKVQISKKPLLCEDDCSKDDLFTCSICHRLLCECNHTDTFFDAQDETICLDCWESKYREEIANFERDMQNELIERLSEFFNDFLE